MTRNQKFIFFVSKKYFSDLKFTLKTQSVVDPEKIDNDAQSLFSFIYQVMTSKKGRYDTHKTSFKELK